MKPVTPQEYAAAYGVFIADLNFVAIQVPALTKFFTTNFSAVALAQKLDPAIFSKYVANLPKMNSTFMKSKPNWKPGYGGLAEITYYKDLELNWTALRIELQGALRAGEVDPNEAASILKKFDSLKPKISK